MTLVNFILLVLIAVLSYCLGAVNGAILISQAFYKKDIRDFGSGNAGMTNMLRNFGAVAALGVVGVDVLKSVIAILLGGWLFGLADHPEVGKLFAGFCLMLGHIFPIYYGFKGGKGVLCGGVSMLMFDWRVGLIVLAAFAAVVFFSRYVSLGSIVSAVAFPVITLIFHREITIIILAVLCGVLVIIKHKDNINRLLTGREPTLQFKGKKTSSN